MWTWLKENHAIISALSSFAMLGVWMLYLHLFYSSYRHQLRPKILITRGGGDTVAARCIVTNMSSEIIFVQAVFLRLSYPDREQVYSLSEADRKGFSPSDRRSELVQGPLRSGDFLDLGSFEELLSSVLGSGDARDELAAADALSVVAVGCYTWHDTPRGRRAILPLEPQQGRPDHIGPLARLRAADPIQSRTPQGRPHDRTRGRIERIAPDLTCEGTAHASAARRLM